MHLVTGVWAASRVASAGARAIRAAAAIAVLLMLPSLAAAQDRAVDMPRREALREQAATAKSRLHLSAEQEVALRGLLEQEGVKLRSIRDADAPRMEKLRQAKEIHDAFRGRIDTILLPDQLAEWDRIRGEVESRARSAYGSPY